MSDEPLHEPFSSNFIRACEMSGASVPETTWRSCFQAAQMVRGLGRPMGLGTDWDASRTVGLVTVLIACLDIEAPEAALRAARLRAVTSEEDLPPEVRAEHADYPYLPAMLAAAISLFAPGERS